MYTNTISHTKWLTKVFSSLNSVVFLKEILSSVKQLNLHALYGVRYPSLGNHLFCHYSYILFSVWVWLGFILTSVPVSASLESSPITTVTLLLISYVTYSRYSIIGFIWKNNSWSNPRLTNHVGLPRSGGILRTAGLPMLKLGIS